MRHAVRYLRRNETDAAMRQSIEGLTLTFRLWLRDLTALLMMYVGEGGEGRAKEAWPALLQTPAVFEQHTTTCLKISRVESTSTTAGSHLCPPHTKLLSMPHAAASCCVPTPHAYLHTYRENGPMLLLRGAGWHLAKPILVSRRSEEGGVQATATLPPRTPHCRSLSHRGTIAGAARLSARRKKLPEQRMRLTARDHPPTRTHSVSPGMGPRRSDTFRAETYSSPYTVL